MSRVGLLGGTFDPPHLGHLLLGTWALATGGVDELLLVPVWVHAFGKAAAPFGHRLTMARLLAEELAPRAVASDVEAGLGAPSRTLRTIEALARARPGDGFRLVIGEDILAECHDWHRWEEVAALAPPLVAGRAGAPRPAGARPREPCLPDVSSSEVRRRLAAGEDAAALVPAPVLDYVRRHGLYGAG